MLFNSFYFTFIVVHGWIYISLVYNTLNTNYKKQNKKEKKLVQNWKKNPTAHQQSCYCTQEEQRKKKTTTTTTTTNIIPINKTNECIRWTAEAALFKQPRKVPKSIKSYPKPNGVLSRIQIYYFCAHDFVCIRNKTTYKNYVQMNWSRYRISMLPFGLLMQFIYAFVYFVYYTYIYTAQHNTL